MLSFSQLALAARKYPLSLVLPPALCLLLLAASCGDDDPTGPNGDGGKGYIAGQAFILQPEHTTQIKIEIFDSETDEKVSTVFPNDQRRFVSDPLDQGTYNLTASIDLPGYFPGQVNNITVVPNSTTEVEVAVQDTSRARFENLEPPMDSRQVARRPIIQGEFRSSGAGYRLNSFELQLNGAVVPDVQITESDPDYHASFAYTPPVNLSPGWVDVRASVFTRSNHQAVATWRFYILEGVSRRVPSEFGTIQEAVIACNDGDTVLVAPGAYNVDNIFLNVDVVLMSEDGRETTALSAAGNRHFTIRGAGRRATIQGFTLSGGRTIFEEPGGSLRVDQAYVLIADCTFTDNQSEDRGGAVVLFESNTRIRDCSFIGNRGYRGGAIAVYDHASPEISNCVFIRNTTTGGLGGAIFVRSADASIHNNTFYRNAAESGSAIFLDFDPSPANVYSDSNIFAENTADENSSTIFFYLSNLSSNCDGFHRNIGTLIDGVAASPEINRLLDLPWETDAGFCDAGAEDLHITTESPFNDAECQRGAYPPGCIP